MHSFPRSRKTFYLSSSLFCMQVACRGHPLDLRAMQFDYSPSLPLSVTPNSADTDTYLSQTFSLPPPLCYSQLRRHRYIPITNVLSHVDCRTLSQVAKSLNFHVIRKLEWKIVLVNIIFPPSEIQEVEKKSDKLLTNNFAKLQTGILGKWPVRNMKT